MAMRRILETVKELMMSSSYKLSELTGISESVLSGWKLKDSTTVNLRLLARLRKVSGLTWKQMGDIVDEEVGE